LARVILVASLQLRIIKTLLGRISNTNLIMILNMKRCGRMMRKLIMRKKLRGKIQRI
jgi:hypothetical protein